MFEDDLVAMIAELMKLSVEFIELDTAMSDYGFDSITLTELANRINQRWSTDIMPTLLFEQENVDDLAQSLVSDFGEVIELYYRDNDENTIGAGILIRKF